MKALNVDQPRAEMILRGSKTINCCRALRGMFELPIEIARLLGEEA